MKTLHLALVSATLGFAGSVATQTTWASRSPNPAPSARAGQILADDPASGVVVFGGSDATGTLLGDTWVWDGATWGSRAPVSAPPPRELGVMVLDTKQGVGVLFGGLGVDPTGNEIYFDDTWLWSGFGWLRLSPATSPPGRHVHGMAFDPVRGRVVMFGGFDDDVFDDTWEWDGVNWADLTPATYPSGREGHAMAWDGNSRRVILFGGEEDNGITDETWAWDGSSWTRLRPATSPPPRIGHGLAWDEHRGRVVLFAGADDLGLLDDTWEWDGADWALRAPATRPSARELFGELAFDLGRGVVVSFGGEDTNGARLAETWEYGAVTAASFATVGPGCPGQRGTPDLHALRLPYVGGSAILEVSNAPLASGAVFFLIGFVAHSPPLDLTAVGMPGCGLAQDIAISVGQGSSAGSAQIMFPVPLTTAGGASLLLQSLVIDAAAGNTVGATLSNAGRLTVGLR